MSRLAGKVALVTGAARGIGKSITEAFVAEGARVVATDILDRAGAEAAGAAGATYAHLDVRREDDWQRVIDEVLAREGRLDVLVNNAGITGFDPPGDVHDPEHASLAAWRAVHETNLDGVFLGCRHAIRAMRPRKSGSIVNIGSRSGVVGIPAAAAYASSKGAVRNHTRTVALYCAEQGLSIRCNVIQPAAVLTPMWDAVLGTGETRESRMAEFSRDTPLRRFGRPEEVAALAVYLASDESGYVTGAEFTIDGGMLAGTAAPPPTAAER